MPDATDAIFGILESLPKILDLFARAEAAMKQADFQNWTASLETAVKKLETAKTDQERLDAVKAMASVTRHLS